MEENRSNLFELQIEAQTQAQLLESAKWAKFLSIVGFIGIGLMVLAGLFAGSTFAALMQQSAGTEAMGVMAGSGSFLMIIFLLVGLLYFFPCFFLYRYASKMKTAIREANQAMLDESLRNLKMLFKFLGILTIIVLSFYLLAFIVGILSAGMMR